VRFRLQTWADPHGPSLRPPASLNLTNTSLIQNRELGIEFSDAGMIDRLQAAFTSDFATPGNSLPAKACTSGNQCVTVPCPPAGR
jgi:hypothetical protein